MKTGEDTAKAVEHMSVLGIQRAQFKAAQRKCPDLAAYAAVLLAIEAEDDPRACLVRLKSVEPNLIGNRALDVLVNTAERRFPEGI